MIIKLAGQFSNMLAFLFIMTCFGVNKSLADNDLLAGLTNGISAGVGVFGQGPTTIFIYLRRSGVSLPFPPPFATRRSIAAYYWGATNSFCGRMELISESGNIIRPLKLDILLPDFYPEQFDLRPLYDDFWERKVRSVDSHMIIPGYVDSRFLCESNRSYQYRYFKLRDLFLVKEPGNFKLTIWPIIYRLSATNENIYERVSLSPVTTPILVTSMSLN